MPTPPASRAAGIPRAAGRDSWSAPWPVSACPTDRCRRTWLASAGAPPGARRSPAIGGTAPAGITAARPILNADAGRPARARGHRAIAGVVHRGRRRTDANPDALGFMGKVVVPIRFTAAARWHPYAIAGGGVIRAWVDD